METTPTAQPDPIQLRGTLAAEGLLDAMPWGVLVLDEQRIIRRINQQAARWCSTPAAALLNQPLDAADLPPTVRTALLQLLDHDGAAPREVFLAEQEHWISLSATRQPGGWALYGQDITPQKQREQQYQSLFQAMDQGFCVLEVLFDDAGQRAEDFRYLELNPAFARQSGMPADVLGKTARQVVPDLEPFWFETYGRVVLTGETVRAEHHVPPVGRWFDVHAFRVGPPEARQVAVLFNDITARKHADTSLRRTVDADAFRLGLVDALGPLSSPVAIEETITRQTRLHFNADRCYYCEITGEQVTIRRDAAADGLPSAAGTYPLTDFGQLRALVEAGRPFAVYDLRQNPALDEALRQQAARLGVVSCLNVPLLKNGQLAGVLCLAQATPREWTAADTALATEVAERTWSAVERARTEQALAASEEKYRTLFAAVDDGFAILELLVDAHGQPADFAYLETNPAFNRQVGVDPQGQRRSEVLPENQALLLEKYAGIMTTGEPLHLEYHMHSLGGRWFQTTAARIGGVGSRRLGVIVRNITERKRREANLAFLADLNVEFAPALSAEHIMARVTERLADYLHLSRCHLAAVDATGELLDVVFDWRRRTEHLPSVLGRHRIDGYLTPAGRAHIDAGRPLVFNGQESSPLIAMPIGILSDMGFGSSVDVPHLIDGRWRFLLSVARAEPSTWTPDEVELLQQLGARIYARLERAQAEAALQDVHAQLAGVLESTHDAFYALDADFNFTYINQRAAQLWGRDPKLLLGQHYWDVFPQAVGSEPYRQHLAVAASGQPAHFETVSPILGIWIEVGMYRTPRGSAVFFRDITARKQAEAAVQASETRFRVAEEAANGFIYDWTAHPDAVTRSAGVRHMLGYAPEDLGNTSATWLGLIHPDDRPAVARWVTPPGDAHVTNEYRVRRADGTYAYVLDRSLLLRDAAGQVARIVGSVVDISERRQAEAALQASEQKYRSLFDSMDEGYCIIEMLYDAEGQPHDWRYIEVNPAFEKNNGLTNATGKTIRELTPDIEPKWFATYGRVAQTGEPLRFEEDSAALGRCFTLYAFPVGVPGSHLVAVLFTDITARKQAEDALRLSEARLSLALQAGRMGSFEWTSEGDHISLSAMSEEVLGLLPDAPFDTSAEGFGLLHPDDRARHHALFDEAGRTGEDYHSIFRVVRPIDGEVRWIEERGQGTRDAGTGVVCLRGVHWDVTETMLAQQRLADFNSKLEQRVARRTRELQASRDLLQSVFDTNLIAMSVQEAVRDENGAVQDFRLRLVSGELVRETGRTDLVGKLYAQEYPGIREAGILDLAVQALETGEPQGMEYFYPFEGFDKWFACQFVKLGDNGIVATNLDITERKKAEQERLKNLRLLEQAEAVAGLGSWDYDLATGILHWSEGMYQLFGLPAGSPVAPADYLGRVVAEDRPRAEQLVQRLAAGAGDSEETLRLQVDGRVKTVRMKSVVLRDAQGQAVRVLGVDLDISELQRLEQDNLRLRLHQQRALFEAVQAAQEAERKRMAESLHNGIGQILYATKLHLDRLHAPLLGTDPALAAARREADQLLGEAIRQTRALSHELVPMMLAEFGLTAALQDICRKMSSPQLRFRCSVQFDDDAAPLGPALQMALYRMAQELTQNVVRHARGASEASLELETMPGWVLFRAEDNGTGFPSEGAGRSGLGLRSIRDRVALLGGQLEIGSVPSGGAYVRIRIPLPVPSKL